MANEQRALDYIEGTVTSANERGFKLDSWEDGWLNISQYAKPTPLVPARGTRVRVGLDSKNYVRTVEPAGETPPSGSRPAQSNGAAPAPAPPYAVHSSDGERDRRITRLAAINSAVAILSSGGRAVEVVQVLPLAGTLEHWVLRTGDDDVAYERFLRTVQPAANDPAAMLGASADAEATQAEFFETATALAFARNTEICRALGVEPSLGGKANPFAVRDWVKAGHSWGEGIGRLRAWRQEHAEEARDG